MSSDSAMIAPPPPRQRGFVSAGAVLFIAAAMGTIRLCDTPACCSTIPMPGGWSLSRFWMPAAGQSWFGAAAAFVGMWVVMMAAMMLPSLMPVLVNYRRAGGDLGWAALAASGYFFAWTLFGMVLYPIGATLAGLAVRNNSISRAAPFAFGVVLLLAGLNQFAPWKSRQLGCCRVAPPAPPCQLNCELNPTRAWKFGLRLGGHCILCCLGFMLTLTVLGAMDLTAMLGVTIGITLERLTANPVRVARASGALIVLAALFTIARAMRLV